ncbi:MAG: hypothetical protein WC713_06655, partial [Candidatus Methylomirabilota bacterium]
MRLWGGTAIARLSDLVRKSGGVSPAKPDPPLSFAEMGTRQAAPASAAAAKQHPSAHRDSARYDLAMQEIGRLMEVAAEGTPFRIATLERLMAEVVQDLVSDDGLLIK